MLLFLATKLRCFSKTLLVISGDDSDAVTDDDIRIRYSLNATVIIRTDGNLQLNFATVCRYGRKIAKFNRRKSSVEFPYFLSVQTLILQMTPHYCPKY